MGGEICGEICAKAAYALKIKDVDAGMTKALPAVERCTLYFTSSSSTSKIRFEFGGIGPAPCAP
jgi:hypothetical protein